MNSGPQWNRIPASFRAALAAYVCLLLMNVGGAALGFLFPEDPRFPLVFGTDVAVYALIAAALIALLPGIPYALAGAAGALWAGWFCSFPLHGLFRLSELPRLLSLLLLTSIPLIAFRKATPAAHFREDYIPTLDGWRAIAILLVIFDHSTLGRWGDPRLRIGQNGVNLFFAISGFLICSKLVAEKESTGHISLMRFYRRRVYRILPPVLPVFALIGIVGCLGWVDLPSGEIASSALYFRNSLRNLTPITGHFWSLSIEEQFYLVVPLLILLLSTRRMLSLALAGAFACGAWRWYFRATHPFVGIDQMSRTHLRLDGLLFGCALAILVAQPEWRERLRRWMTPMVWCLTAVILSAVILVTLPLTTIRESLLWPLLVIGTVLRPESIASRLLESAPLRLIGRLSYSLYLWQQLFLFVYPDRHLRWMHVFPYNLVCLFAVAAASHYFLEKPVLRWARRDAAEKTIPAAAAATA